MDILGFVALVVGFLLFIAAAALDADCRIPPEITPPPADWAGRGRHIDIRI